MTTGMHQTVRFDAHSAPVSSLMGSASMSARRPMVGPVPVPLIMATTPDVAIPYGFHQRRIPLDAHHESRRFMAFQTQLWVFMQITAPAGHVRLIFCNPIDDWHRFFTPINRIHASDQV